MGKENKHLIELGPGRSLAPPQPPGYFPPAPPAILLQDQEQDEVHLPFSHYVWVLRRNAWKILLFIAGVTAAAGFVSLRLTPIYEATATLYVDRQEARGIVGQEAQAAVVSSSESEQFLASQIRLIQSDSVVRPVAERFSLLEREKQLDLPAEKSRAQDAPILLKNLRVTRPVNTTLLHLSYRSTDPRLAADVANQIAQSYIEHTYNIRIRSSASISKFMERQIEELRAKMESSSERLARLEREMNVINPEEKTNILSARLLQLNSEYTKAQSERVAAEAAFTSTRNGDLESAQVSGQGEQLKRLVDRRNEAGERFSEVKTHFGPNHPEYRRALASVNELDRQIGEMRASIARRMEVQFREALTREQMLARGVAETKAEYDSINLRSFDYQRAKREADADKQLYEELVRKIREAGINAGFQNNTVRVADPARAPWKPVFPRLWLILLLALLFSSVTAVAVALVSDSLDTTIRDPEQVSQTLRIHMVGTLPAMKNVRELRLPAAEGAKEEGVSLLPVKAAPRPERQFSAYEEAVRTLRSSILLSDFDRRLRTMFLTSATAGEGKSTTASHLAVAHAEQGRRTLIVDCDLRRPSQHKMFGLSIGNGLSNVLQHDMSWREAVLQPASAPALDLITAGPPSRRAADLLGPRMAELIEEWQKEYDLVILDGPPLLGFAESLQIATLADGVLVVTRAGQTNRKAVAAAITTLQHLRVNVVGLVLNQVKKHMSDHYYYYGYYGKYYKEYQAAPTQG
jgi:capsular exopolysaccharide synthesis family protein